MKDLIKKYLVVFGVLGLAVVGINFTPLSTPLTVQAEASSSIAKCKNKSDGSGITCLVNILVDILNMAVGAIAVLMLVVGGVMYASAGDDSGKVSTAKKIITNTIIGVILYIFLFAILNFIIPGGIGGGGGGPTPPAVDPNNPSGPQREII